MPTYLTPGVYVDESPSTSKPRGGGASVAAFVGLAPGGPLNTPMRISNWTQFAKIYGDSDEPDNGPFMEGAYLAHSVYGFFQNGGTVCWVVRVSDTATDLADSPSGENPTGADPGATTSRAVADADDAGAKERPGNVSRLLSGVDEITMVLMPDLVEADREGRTEQAWLAKLQSSLLSGLGHGDLEDEFREPLSRPAGPERFVAHQQLQRNLQAREALLARCLLADDPDSGAADSSQLDRWRRDGKVVAVTHRESAVAYPAFQFNDGRPDANLREPIRVFREHGASDWQIALWFTTLNPWLRAAPADVIDERPTDVAFAASRTFDFPT